MVKVWSYTLIISFSDVTGSTVVHWKCWWMKQRLSCHYLKYMIWKGASTRETLQAQLPIKWQLVCSKGWLKGQFCTESWCYLVAFLSKNCVQAQQSDWESEYKSLLLENTCLWNSEVWNRTNLCSFLFYLFSFLWGKENERRTHSINVELNKQRLFGCKTQSALVFHWLYVQDVYCWQ